MIVDSIFKIERTGEPDRLMDNKLDNNRLLFHGTFSSNLVSILRRGLLTVPPEAPITGRSLGDVSTVKLMLDHSQGDNALRAEYMNLPETQLLTQLDLSDTPVIAHTGLVD